MSKKKKETERAKIFEKVGLAFRNPVRVEIIKELSDAPQRPIDLSNKIGVPKQQINYHLQSLKKGGIVKVHKEKLPEPESKPKDLPDRRGVTINGLDESGEIQVSYGVELTRNGKKIANSFVKQLYLPEEEEKPTRKKGEEKIIGKEKLKEGET